MSDDEKKEGFLQTAKTQLIILGVFLAIFWGLELIDQVLLHQALDKYGIRPRTGEGLIGIFFAPFLHVGFAHVTSNSVPFLVMGWLLLIRGTGQFFLVVGLVTVMEGMGVWLIGASNSVHLGASGVVFGFFGFLLVAGILERSLKSILSALIVGFAYGGIVWGVLPTQRGVSWEGHLFGMLSGGLIAYWMVGHEKKEESKSNALRPTI